MGEAEREPETPAQPSAVSCCGALLLADLAGLKIWFAETLYDAFCHLKSDCTPCAVIAIDSSTGYGASPYSELLIFLSGYLVLGTIEIITRHGRNRTAKSPGWEGGSQKNAATAARASGRRSGEATRAGF